MQLKKNISIRTALTAATCSLFIPTPEQEAQAAESGHWTVDLGAYFYKEFDRVSIFEPAAILTRHLEDDSHIAIRMVSDTMTGASPNGASVSGESQHIPVTATSASGNPSNSTKLIAPNTLPTDAFSDQRYAVGVDWSAGWTRTLRTIIGVNYSGEHDYRSIQGNVTVQKETDDRLTTFTTGISATADTAFPVGGITPQGMATVTSVQSTNGEAEEEREHQQGEQKLLLDGVVGITQVLRRNLLTQLNYSLGVSRGYLSDPYKMVGLVNPVSGITTSYIHEKRPSLRLRQSLYWKTVVNFGEDVMHVTYRYFWDNWKVQAHTIETKYRYAFDDHFYLTPNVRYYRQSSADFFTYYFFDNQTLPSTASADLRLAAMQSATGGIKVGYAVGSSFDIGFRAEYMRQWAVGAAESAIPGKPVVSLFPNMQAMMYTASISYEY